MLTAAEANAVAKKHKPAGLAHILEVIEHSARRGELKMTINHKGGWGDSNDILAELKKLGYKAKFVSDQRDGDYYDIRW